MAFAYNVFVDFDGTITEIDVGYEMFKRFTHAATEPLVQRYRQGGINSRQCLAGECDIWNSCAPAVDDVDEFLKNQSVRRGFAAFIDCLQASRIDPVILSEGFDFYIDKFLDHHGLTHLARITNVAAYSNGRLAPSFPYFEAGCGSCSNCKGYHIGRLRPLKSCAIFIGDGHSDLHASRAADIVFARSFLAECMLKTEASFVPYNDFIDIGNRIQEFLSDGIFALGKQLVFKFVSARHHDSLRGLWECGEVMKHVGYPNGLGWNRERYDEHFASLQSREDLISLTVENRSGEFIGEAKIAFPDSDGLCCHDIKFLPKFRGEVFGLEAWKIILERAAVRWPKARAMVTPAVDNEHAIDLHLKLGFQFVGEAETWIPPENTPGAIPVRFRKMVRDPN